MNRRGMLAGLFFTSIQPLCSASARPAANELLGDFDRHTDVGETGKPGNARFTQASGAMEVTGAGANIWGKTDAFQYVYRSLGGDFSLTADVLFEGQGTELHRKAALMIRQSLDPDAPYADIALHGDGLTALQYRPGAGVETSEFRLAMKYARRLFIQRQGHEITVAASDGKNTAQNGPVVVSMTDPVLVGLAVCSHNASVLETALFSRIRWNQKGLS